jgi:hypothetical protein
MPSQPVVDVVDFFDPHADAHLLAYRHLCVYGRWPRKFLPENTTCPPYWQALIVAKIADAWLLARVGTRIPSEA